jgi:CubicO group peptidase (beta-lactamase class C family)
MFGHSGMGGSLVVCDPVSRTSIAITVNRLTLDREFTRTVANHVCQELGLGVIFDLD